MPERQRMTTRLKTRFQRPELFVLAGGIKRRSASFPGPSSLSFPPTCRPIPPYRRSRKPGPPRLGFRR